MASGNVTITVRLDGYAGLIMDSLRIMHDLREAIPAWNIDERSEIDAHIDRLKTALLAALEADHKRLGAPE